jgi:hypothetical protein
MVRRSMWVALVAAVTVVVAACAPPTTTPPPSTTTTVVDPAPQAPVGDDLIRLNQIQLLGSHNSYHVAPDPRVIDLLKAAASAFPALAGGLGDPSSLDYTHAPIPDQLAAGIRTFELDTYADPTGGRFANPKLNANFGFHDPELDYDALAQPGFKVFHIVDIDQRSRCTSLVLCLTLMKDWSDAHPGHLPIVINIELEESALPAPLIGTPVLPFDSARFDALDATIRSVVGDRLITPDDVRGSAPDLRTAVTTTGWPTLAASRGKFLFFMDNDGSPRDIYLQGHPSLQGRVLFTSSGEGQPDGAIIRENDPTQTAHIAQLVSEGYIVRTRADADLVENRADDTTHRDEAFASGAQIIHSDSPPNEPFPNGYVVTFGTRVAGRCNPANTTPATCTPAAVTEAN